MSQLNQKALYAAGAAALSDLYANPMVAEQATEAAIPVPTQDVLAALGIGAPQAATEDHLFLAGIRQRKTSDVADRFAGLTAEQIEAQAKSMGLEVEWVQV